MVKVTFSGKGGESVSVEAAAGTTLMEAAQRAKVPGIPADCGGGCSCATCHVLLSPDWFAKLPAVGAVEAGMLETTPHMQEGASRLSCQIRLTEELDGLVCAVPQ